MLHCTCCILRACAPVVTVGPTGFGALADNFPLDVFGNVASDVLSLYLVPNKDCSGVVKVTYP
jgi:hypothetical protein